jgi:uncharacterized lipoprotein YajG
MKRIFILAAALCLGACASQPTTVVTANQPATQTGGAALAVTAQAGRSSGRVYLDDHELIHVQAPPSNRRMLVLGARKETN